MQFIEFERSFDFQLNIVLACPSVSANDVLGSVSSSIRGLKYFRSIIYYSHSLYIRHAVNEMNEINDTFCN